MTFTPGPGDGRRGRLGRDRYTEKKVINVRGTAADIAHAGYSDEFVALLTLFDKLGDLERAMERGYSLDERDHIDDLMNRAKKAVANLHSARVSTGVGVTKPPSPTLPTPVPGILREPSLSDPDPLPPWDPRELPCE